MKINFLISLAIILINPSSAHDPNHDTPYSFTSLDNQAGIFYHDLGLAKLSYGSYTLLSYTNISFYHYTLQSIRNIFEKSLAMCSKTSDTLACRDTLKLCKSQIPILESKFDTISHLVGRPSSNSNDINSHVRERRGIFNGASYAFNWLFGIPDAGDAKFYSDSIKELEQNNHDIQMLMKQQIHIISGAIKNYNESAQSLRKNEEKLNENIKKFNHFSKTTSNSLNSLSQNQLITEYLALLSQMIAELQEQYDTIISSILFAKQNTLHPSIITPKDIKNELMQVKLNPATQFPIPLNDYNNIYKYFSISDLSVVFDNEVLIVAIKIPLVQAQTYYLYNLIPLPVRHSNSSIYSFINPSYPYLLVSTTKTHYSRLRDMSTCKKLSPEDFICFNPIVHLASERPVCEIILKNRIPDRLPEDCPTHTIKANIEIWHPLSSNSWIFIASQPSIASIYCENSNPSFFDLTINGTGILEMKPRCKCYTSSTVLSSTTNDSRIYNNYTPHVNIVADDCCLQKASKIQHQENQMDTINLNDLNFDDLNHAQRKLEQFDEILQTSINHQFLSYRPSWFSILISLIGIIILVFFCCCCNCSWLPYVGRSFRKGKGCCGMIPSICITNHNERYELSEEQALRLNRLQPVYEDDPSSLNSRELVPLSSGIVPSETVSECERPSGVQTRSRKTHDRRFHI